MTARTGPSGPGPEAGGPAEVILHEERLLLATQRVVTERVRITKRIVSTTRTIEVPVRIEQLVITHEPLDPTDLGALPSGGPAEDVVILLHEEVPEVTLRVVAVERVVVGKRDVAGEQVVTVDLVAETAEVTTLDVTP
ncbi:YsnF/AvaK domain-containing protein [Kineococcus sp. NBC_00420]|uniref:YsnF/AvaK domain-containing protein n=1 Tax=Kineococcus sp. NBC_00420 TaxID=2903564 RepID=UPI002E240CCA